MENLVSQLDFTAEVILQSTVAKQVSFYFPESWVDVNKEGFSVSSVSINPWNKDWIIIENAWGDTEHDYLDIHRLSVNLRTEPKDIRFSLDANSVSGIAFSHVSTIVTWTETYIKAISLYETSASGSRESVRYDSALLFEYEKGAILISCDGTTAEQLRINHKVSVIEEILSTMTVRKMLT